MRINKFVAQATGLSRRAADRAIQDGRVEFNQRGAHLGDIVGEEDIITLDKQRITHLVKTLTVMLNKPRGYVCSRQGQGSKTIYDLLPADYQALKPVGRLDKDSSGLLLLTSDGDLANQLTHPRYTKTKVYEVSLNKPLERIHYKQVANQGLQLDDGLSKFSITKRGEAGKDWQVTMHEGRNRQIRRTFLALGYTVKRLHRIQFGSYKLNDLPLGHYIKQ